ncbi:helix-turn-helix transcriptional regulator [Paenibacillus sp. J2TS4]|uniref:helix-turn-helix transcriptional regulator n=1 Tax=Paenibacillus sp. J2TS4 TaxID=2807194 RepID=UPI001BCF718E|nr:AraC family transcriptional regulator [Paenibacillus sp. J2TS4]
MVTNLWDRSLQLISHAYWERKEQFVLHKDSYPIWVMFAVESGSFKYQIGNEQGLAKPNELVFCPPGCTFERKALSPISLHYVGFDFDKALIPEENPLPMFKAQPTDKNRVASSLSYLRMLHLAVDPRSQLRKQLMMNDLWQLACSEWDLVPNQDELTALTHTDDEQMKWSVKWLVEKAHTPFSIRELSDLVGLSPAQFSRRFKKAFRMNPSELVRTLRIRKAAKLLLNSDLTLDQIAEQCGYDNGFYLSRVFTRYMNMNPSEYRHQNQV